MSLEMVMAREGKEGGEMEIEEEENMSNPSNPPERIDVIQELVAVVDSVKSFGNFRRTQKKESQNLVRRLKLLLPLLEEIGDLDMPIPEACIDCLHNLKKAFLSAKRLLKICNDGSKLYLALESDAITVRFHSVYDKLSQALDGMPYDELGISDEVKEQTELMRVQLRRAKRRTDTQDMELAMDMMVVLSTKYDDRNADSASIERLANKLSLHTVEDLKTETIAMRKLVKERGGQHAESTQQIIDLLNKFKRIAGVEETNVLDDPVMPKALDKCPSLAIPNEFLCPITLEIMTDPVIIATGQTYERESIQQWLDSNHRTCPKTGQTLAHLSLAPNFALRNLILQWCEKNNFQLPKKDALSSSEDPSVEQRERILWLVQNLSSSHLEVQRKTVMKIRMLSKESPESRILIAKCGGIPALVHLLSYPDSRIQEHAVTALLNLSIDESNKKLITREESIPAIIEVLQNGSVGAKENSAAALFSLSMLDENKVTIGLSNGIPPLVVLLQNGTIRGKKDAATALFNLSLNQGNKTRAIEAGVVKSLLEILEDKNLDMVDEALSILLLLASHPDGRQEIGQISFIETLVHFIGEGTPKNKECAAAVLLELGSNNSNLILAALQYGVYEHLVEIANSGTNRAQRKANSLLQLMSKSEQISA
uniref:RING-type E3 ubiquitin transferase n=1 Tax=Davidia involucrata TaxID=16924 RepID=A0A5B7AI49_DAVIN